MCAQPSMGVRERNARIGRDVLVVAVAQPCGCGVDEHAAALHAGASATPQRSLRADDLHPAGTDQRTLVPLAKECTISTWQTRQLLVSRTLALTLPRSLIVLARTTNPSTSLDGDVESQR